MIVDKIKNLQKKQLRHDEDYHQDILVLDTVRRAKHMALHNAKYLSRFVCATEDSDGNLYQRTLTDAFVISLATANLFAQDLSMSLPTSDTNVDTFGQLGNAINNAGSGQFIRAYAEQTGAMAKACESIDHLEDFPFRTVLIKANQNIFCAIVKEAALRQIDIERAYEARISDVEAKSPRQFLI